MKKLISLSNFFNQNTPKLLQLIGDISMVCGFIVGLPAAIAEFGAEAQITIAIPAIVLKASKIAAIILLGIKFCTKFFGEKLPNDNNQPAKS